MIYLVCNETKPARVVSFFVCLFVSQICLLRNLSFYLRS